MRLTGLRLIIFFGSVAAIVTACGSQKAATVVTTPRRAFEASFLPGSRDEAGRFMGGTEVRVLAAHAGRLYAGNGYWQDGRDSKGFKAHRFSRSMDRVHAGGSITPSTSGCQMGVDVTSPSRLSTRSPSQPTATRRGCSNPSRC
jgi:hypothetical protein